MPLHPVNSFRSFRTLIINARSGEITCKSVKFILSPSEEGSTQRGKNFLPVGANSFLLELTPFQKGHGEQE